MDAEAHAEQIWRSFAFLARYGHQPIHEIRHLPVCEVMVLGQYVADLLKDEKAPLGED